MGAAYTRHMAVRFFPVTLGQETVGGPVDVAVISKGDGFIWMRRKHYFSAALNPQFFSDHFGATHAPPITPEKRP